MCWKYWLKHMCPKHWTDKKALQIVNLDCPKVTLQDIQKERLV